MTQFKSIFHDVMNECRTNINTQCNLELRICQDSICAARTSEISFFVIISCMDILLFRIHLMNEVHFPSFAKRWNDRAFHSKISLPEFVLICICSGEPTSNIPVPSIPQQNTVSLISCVSFLKLCPKNKVGVHHCKSWILPYFCQMNQR